MMFVTSELFDGNLEGLTGADGHCQRLADEAQLGGTFQAWLSTSSASVNTRFINKSDGPYVRFDGTQLASNWNDLVSCGVSVDFFFDEYGNASPGNASPANYAEFKDIFSSTTCSGNFATQSNANECQDYTLNAGTGIGVFLKSGNNKLQTNVLLRCEEKAHSLLCVQQSLD